MEISKDLLDDMARVSEDDAASRRRLKRIVIVAGTIAAFAGAGAGAALFLNARNEAKLPGANCPTSEGTPAEKGDWGFGWRTNDPFLDGCPTCGMG